MAVSNILPPPQLPHGVKIETRGGGKYIPDIGGVGGFVDFGGGHFVRYFTLPEVNKATADFSPSKILGKGGYGTVYCGDARDGSLCAVKRSNNRYVNVEGEEEVTREFHNEVSGLALYKLQTYVQNQRVRLVANSG